jgi:nucleotide-binding universal stress UspA family protein
MFRRLLVAINDGDGSAAAVSFAVSQANPVESQVHVVHVNEYIPSSRSVPLNTDDEATQVVVEAIEQLRLEGIRAAGSVRRADHREVAQVIAATAVETGSEAIVIGSNRRRRFGVPRRARLHDQIMALSPLPILTAPPPLSIPTDTRSLGEQVPNRRPQRRSRLTA